MTTLNKGKPTDKGNINNGKIVDSGNTNNGKIVDSGNTKITNTKTTNISNTNVTQNNSTTINTTNVDIDPQVTINPPLDNPPVIVEYPQPPVILVAGGPGPIDNGPIDLGPVDNGPIDNGPVDNGSPIDNGTPAVDPSVTPAPTLNVFVYTLYYIDANGQQQTYKQVPMPRSTATAT